MPPKKKTAPVPIVEIPPTSPRPPRRGAKATRPNSSNQTPGAGPSNSANATPVLNTSRPTKPLPATRKKANTSVWAPPPPLTQPRSPESVPQSKASASGAGASARRSKRGQPDTPDEGHDSSASIKRLRPNPRLPPTSPNSTAGGSTQAAPKKSATRGDDDDEVVIEDVVPAPDNEPMSAEDRQELMVLWEKNILDLIDRTIAAPVHDEKLAKELGAAYMGSCYVRYIGVNEITGVVNLDLDPNARGNPRSLNEGHVTLLRDILIRPNAKKDHESPLFLAVAASAVDPKQRDVMMAADARNILSQLPPLILKRPDAAKENRLENELWSQSENGRWLSIHELDARKKELEEIRADPTRAKATLLNGNHRTRAMLAINPTIERKRDEVRLLIEKNPSNKADVEREVHELNQMVENHTWRCLVYDEDKLTPSARNYLVHNTHERPAMGMALGEKVWWLGTYFETEMGEQQGSGSTQRCTRAQAANTVQKRWRKELGVKMSSTGPEEADSKKHGSHAKQLGDLAGTDAASRLFYNPASMEMVLDCRPALWAFQEIVDKPLAIEMLRPNGGPLIAHTWLSLRTLLTLANVSGGDKLTEAENWIRQNEKIVPEGHEEAVELFQALHVRPERVPQLLSKYGKEQADLFGSMFNAAVEPLAIGGRVDYTSAKVLIAIRGVFDRFGRTFLVDKQASAPTRLFAASMQLYSRLPTFVSGRTAESFYPLATLPSIVIRDNVIKRWTGGWGASPACESLMILEELIDVGQMMWTLGSEGSKRSSNSENWYDRSHGFHQVVLRFFSCKSIGPIEARLSEALSIFEDPRLPIAMRAVEGYFKQDDSLDTLTDEFCTKKTADFKYLGLERILETSQLDHGPYEEVIEHIFKARCAIRASAWADADLRAGKPRKARQAPIQTLDQILADHPVLGLVHEKVWDHVWPTWFVGWDDQEGKRMGSVGMGLGWALLHRYVIDNVIPKVMKIPQARCVVARLVRPEEPSQNPVDSARAPATRAPSGREQAQEGQAGEER
ncbi:hypothetical protein FRC12_011876 [Ceratobasidium sp. 428]|nr:hypothetical protein FRC12_011876 [Ceratobasidium sp. 428]